MPLSILYFAGLKDLLGVSQEALTVPVSSTVADVVRVLTERHPRLRLDGVRIAVNLEFAGNDLVLKANDEVALIPPVCGG